LHWFPRKRSPLSSPLSVFISYFVCMFVINISSILDASTPSWGTAQRRSCKPVNAVFIYDLNVIIAWCYFFSSHLRCRPPPPLGWMCFLIFQALVQLPFLEPCLPSADAFKKNTVEEPQLGRSAVFLPRGSDRQVPALVIYPKTPIIVFQHQDRRCCNLYLCSIHISDPTSTVDSAL